jgi:putative Mn2+ efflux pump MntP
MIIESFKEETTKKKIYPEKFSVVLLLGLSTSIDALAVGFSLNLIRVHILLAVAIITLITFLAVLLGIYIGKKSKTNKWRRAEIIGGIILIAIGVKIVLEHTVWQ